MGWGFGGGSRCGFFNLNVLFTNAFDLHQLTSAFVFWYKSNPEKHFSPHLVHQGCWSVRWEFDRFGVGPFDGE
jgi:hypothetical protein